MTGLDEAFDDDTAHTAPIWAVFGDLMAGLLGAFVLILVGVLVVQIDLVASLKQEVEKRQIEEQRRMALEKALAIPLASGRVTVNNGRIGISGSVLFALNSDQLQPEGRQVLKSLAAPLAAYLREYINVETASDSMSADDAIVLTTDPTLGREAYTLAVKPQRIEITGGDYGGVFNGIQALLRLLPPKVYAKACPLPVEVACTRIDDAPRFAYRGMMLDVARTWIGVDGVKRYIDLLSYHGINKLHLHLSDDEGWRIEIRSHPELTEIGGFRGGDSPVRPVYGKWDEKYGGFYTQDEMRGLIRYAAVRNIEIIPEIDLPGHSRNIASVHPEIRCNYPPDTLSTNGYDYRSAWCVAREENYALLADILGELCALFPSEYIHVGGDEVDDPLQVEPLLLAQTVTSLRRVSASLRANCRAPSRLLAAEVLRLDAMLL